MREKVMCSLAVRAYRIKSVMLIMLMRLSSVTLIRI